MKKAIDFIKTEPVLVIALALAAISAFFIPPDAAYFSYIDFKTLALLFCLMAVMAGLSAAGFFTRLAEALLRRVTTVRGVVASLTLLCFFFSSLITNDVALITFVPFAIIALRLADRADLIPITVILQTIAANMGSCLTPIGNPQNMYLYNISGLGFLEFFLTMLPWAALSLVFLLVALLFIKNGPIAALQGERAPLYLRAIPVYAVVFALCLLSVLRLVHFGICLGVTLAVLLLFDRGIFKKIDYSLLLTFIGFFIFVGNMGRIPAVRDMISTLLQGREVIFSAAISQVISNVPAALLLSGFTESFDLVLIGVNIGGLGTLIASMASLISYKFVARELPHKKGRYLAVFTALNLLLLAILLGIYLI
ncbi:MAG: citrate transporter [Clostridia bacterium]|nr:citrate transporter [Clostridia bacterium]